MKGIRYAAAALLLAAPLAAQTAVEHVAMGDKLYATRNAAEALKHYEAAVAADSNDYDAAWKAARAAVDVGEASGDKAQQTQYYVRAEALARRAVKDNPNDAEGHFHLARALGKRALSLGVTDRIKYATSVREQALEALRLNPNHPGALHVMGVWNAEIMRLNGFQRMMAKNFLGGKVFGTANWDDAQRYMEKSVALDPNRPVHYVDLGEVYADRDMTDRARAAFEKAIALAPVDPNDSMYKAKAQADLNKLK